ncbi:MAG: hypothetical protein ACOZFS_14620 [Thermodesulfobacteriota bacterium]
MEQAHYFRQQHKEHLKEATVIAEEVTSDFFKLSPSHWRRARYDILTLEALRAEEISPHALALVAKYNGRHQDRLLQSAVFDFYRVCLQDHNILKTLKYCNDLSLFPLLLYIVTHELVHVVRFSQFLALYETPEKGKQEEERRVHHLTQQILAPLKVRDLPPVIKYYDDNLQGGWQYAHL